MVVLVFMGFWFCVVGQNGSIFAKSTFGVELCPAYGTWDTGPQKREGITACIPGQNDREGRD